MSRRLFAVLLVCAVLVGCVGATGQPSTPKPLLIPFVAQPGNLLTNPSFDGPTYTPKGQMALVLPSGWGAGWIDSGSVYRADPGGAYVIGTINKYGTRPRDGMAKMLKPEMLVIQTVAPYLDPPRIFEGTSAVTSFKLYGTFTSWIYQVMTSTPGMTYTFGYSAHAWARMSEDPNDAHFSHGIGTGPFYAEDGDPRLDDNTSNFRFRACIDPFGGMTPFASSVKCGKGSYIYNQYHSVPSISAMARADSITVFAIIDDVWGMVNSNSYADAAFVNLESQPAPVTQVPPTVTPVTPSPVPPTVTPTPTGTVITTTELCQKFNYVTVVNLLPQDATQAEWLYVANLSLKERQTVTMSADDARRLATYGAVGSKVVVWDPCRWTQGDILVYLGVPTGVRKITCP